MTELVIQADDQLMAALRQFALQKAKTLEDLIRDALAFYVQELRRQEPERYSFIGIGKSGQKDLSVRAEEILEQAANRREGWSLE